MRNIVDSRGRWKVLQEQFHFPSLTDLEQSIKVKDGDSPCESGIRSVCWRVFLLHEHVNDPPSWLSQVNVSRDAYTSLRSHFLKYIDHPDDLPSTTDPLAEDEESPWQQLRQDEATRAEIYQDVERCLQENYFFQEPTTKVWMLDILFIYTRLNPDLGYRQGMHELLAPILWVVAHDAIDKSSLSEANDKQDELMLGILDSDYIEHDAFTIFCAIMRTAKQFYEYNDTKSAEHPQETSSIVHRSHRIHQVVLRRLDVDLADHIQSVEVLPQIFLTRWIRLLFGREFSFHETLSLWDLLFVEDMRLEIIDLVCVVMLLRIRQRLLKSDYSTALGLLLRYPSPEPFRPADFALDALFLEQNFSPESAASLVSKYSGDTPRQLRGQSVDSSSQPRKPQKANAAREARSQPQTEAGTPSRSPVRIGPKRLDSLFQDVSGGLYRRTEGWGMAKAVRGAVGEARRNIQNIQSSASSPALVEPDTLGSPPPPRASLSLQGEEAPSARVAALESRNKTLAKLLDDSLAKLNSHKENLKDQSDDSEQKGVIGAIDTIRYVQARLEDPKMPISEAPPRNGSKTTDARRSQNTSISSTNITPATTEPKSTNPPKTANAPSEKKAPTPTTPPRDSGNTEPTKVETPQPVRPAARAALADSTFSWMLGESGSQTSFMACTSSPPERKRGGEGSRRPDNLFGDNRGHEGGSSQRTNEGDGVVLNRLRGSPGQ